MHKVTTLALAGVGATIAAMAPQPAAAQEKLSKCYVGQRVQIPPSSMGTVVRIPRPGACDVHWDGYKPGTYDTWSAWMLTSVPGSPVQRAAPIASTPRAGNYQCFGGSAGNMKLRFGGGNTYANEQGATGTYRMRPSGQMEFVSGPWQGFYAKTLEGGRVGLTSRPDSSFYQMTCDPR